LLLLVIKFGKIKHTLIVVQLDGAIISELFLEIQANHHILNMLPYFLTKCKFLSTQSLMSDFLDQGLDIVTDMPEICRVIKCLTHN